MAGRHTIRDGKTGQFAPKPKLDPRFRPHHPKPSVTPTTATVGMNPDAPAKRQAAPEVAKPVPYIGESPTGFSPATATTGEGWDAAVTASL